MKIEKKEIPFQAQMSFELESKRWFTPTITQKCLTASSFSEYLGKNLEFEVIPEINEFFDFIGKGMPEAFLSDLKRVYQEMDSLFMKSLLIDFNMKCMHISLNKELRCSSCGNLFSIGFISNGKFYCNQKEFKSRGEVIKDRWTAFTTSKRMITKLFYEYLKKKPECIDIFLELLYTNLLNK